MLFHHFGLYQTTEDCVGYDTSEERRLAVAVPIGVAGRITLSCVVFAWVTHI